MTDLPAFYTPENVPLPVNRNLRYRMARERKLPVIQIGKRLLIPRAAFERWVETCGGTFPAIETATTK